MEVRTLPVLKSKQKRWFWVATFLSHHSILAKIYWESSSKTRGKQDICLPTLKERQGRSVFLCARAWSVLKLCHDFTTSQHSSKPETLRCASPGLLASEFHTDTRKQTSVWTTDYKWAVKWAEAAMLLIKITIILKTHIFISKRISSFLCRSYICFMPWKLTSTWHLALPALQAWNFYPVCSMTGPIRTWKIMQNWDIVIYL